MVVITKAILNKFGQRYSDVADTLNEWYMVVKAADWKNLAALKQTIQFSRLCGQRPACVQRKRQSVSNCYDDIL